MTTVRAWLDARDPAPPPALAGRAREVLGEHGGLAAAPTAEPFLVAAEALLGRMLREGSDTRRSALDLLVADALVTWAFESATEGEDDLVLLAGDAMSRIGCLAGDTAGREA